MKPNGTWHCLRRGRLTRRFTALRDQGLIRSLSAFSLAKEDQVNENAYHHRCHDDHLLQVFRI